MKITFAEEGWSEYLYWQTQDKKILKKINQLLQSIERDGVLCGIGKPEPLKNSPEGEWSRRINDEHRLVYRVQNGMLEIASCRDHYS